MIRPPIGHCRTLMTALMRWSDPVCRVTVMAPTTLEALAKKNILMKEEKGHFIDMVRCPSLVVFKWRLDAQVEGTGEDVSCLQLEGSFQL